MDWGNIGMKMEIISRECILKTKKEAMAVITLVKVEFCSHNLILYPLKFQK